jgi:uncharacterized membrane protein YfcA
MDWISVVLLIGGGLVAGIVNTLAGGGSLLTVPLLVELGLPGTLANGTNRIGVLVQNLTAAWSFRAEGFSGLAGARPILLPALAGSILGAYGVAQLTDNAFESAFGVVMIALLVPTLRKPAPRSTSDAPAIAWSRRTSMLVFFAIGLYGGAFQAGVGIALIFALNHAGYDLVRANSIKVIVIAALTLVAIPVFVFGGQIAWAPAGLLAIGFAIGGSVGARIAVAGGERVIRPVLVAAVLALAGRMIGLY